MGSNPKRPGSDPYFFFWRRHFPDLQRVSFFLPFQSGDSRLHLPGLHVFFDLEPIASRRLRTYCCSVGVMVRASLSNSPWTAAMS